MPPNALQPQMCVGCDQVIDNGPQVFLRLGSKTSPLDLRAYFHPACAITFGENLIKEAEGWLALAAMQEVAASVAAESTPGAGDGQPLSVEWIPRPPGRGKRGRNLRIVNADQ